MPYRVTLNRAKGWKMPENTLKVDRSTRWGNPFGDEQVGLVFGHEGYPMPVVHLHTAPSRGRCLDLYVAYLKGRLAADRTYLHPLRGKNLACWCKPDELCHADVLLRLANRHVDPPDPANDEFPAEQSAAKVA